jgi:Flp pilus assembly protein TadG
MSARLARWRRRRSDRGSILVEFALILPLLVLLVLGTIEYGSAWRSSATLSASLRATVRTATQVGSQPVAAERQYADFEALKAYMGAIGQDNRLTTVKVVIYKIADSNSTGAVPSNCLGTSAADQGGVRDVCNVYEGTDFTTGLVASNFGCGSGSNKLDKQWCPTNRSNSLTGSGPDALGVYAEVRYTGLTKLLPGGSTTLTDNATGRVEAAPL